MEFQSNEDKIMSTIYVVAGGPSLNGYNFNLLKNKRVIAVNRAHEKLPNAEVIYFSDKRFFEWFEGPLLGHTGRKVTGANLHHPAVENYQLTGHKGLDERPGCLKAGNNSAYAAINLAFHMGAERIVVLGLDMKFGPGGETHWHSGYVTMNMVRSFEKMKPFFSSLAHDLLDHDVTVLNANMDSNVDVFERIPLEVAHLV